MSLGKMFISAVVAEKSVASFLGFGPIGHLFKPNELPAYEFVQSFVKQYGSLPTDETIEAHTGDELVLHKEPAAYYADLLQARHTEVTVKQAMKKASDMLLPENKDPDAALASLTDAIMALATQKSQKKITDFRDAYDLIVAHYVAKYNADMGTGLEYGWPTLDGMTGGVRRGDMVSFVGRPGKGKTWQMLYGAHHGWDLSCKAAMAAKLADKKDEKVLGLAGQSRMFVSMEMSALAIEERLAAMQTKVPMSKLDQGDLSTFGLKKLKKGLTEIKGYDAPFWVIDGNLAATVEEIWMIARQLKPDAIFIDGGYLVKHPKEKDRFRRVAENADLMKSELAAIAPTTVSWQFARSASKKKKGEKVDGDDIGYSDAILQVSSVVVGLFEQDSVETLHQRRNDILKGRKGEVGSYITRWDFQNMDFTEVVEQAVEELQFI